MIKKILVIWIMLLMPCAYADSVRCGGKIAQKGDTATYVLEICGEPIRDEIVTLVREGYISGVKRSRLDEPEIIDTRVVRQLVYKINNVFKVFEIRDGIVFAIKDGHKVQKVLQSGRAVKQKF